MANASFQGLRTAVYFVADLPAASKWYAEMLGVAPWVDTPYYVGFDVGGYELGLHPAEGQAPGPGGTQAYWGVPDIHAAHERLLRLGARPHKAIQEVSPGIRLASVLDPWNNVLGLIENTHFGTERGRV